MSSKLDYLKKYQTKPTEKKRELKAVIKATPPVQQEAPVGKWRQESSDSGSDCQRKRLDADSSESDSE
jgi:hypothetical protein